MSTEFLRLYRELEQITPSTVYDEKKLTAQRNDVMARLGYKNVGAGQMKYTKCAKFHGKQAREDAHEARQVALLNDAKAKAQRRMMVHNAVHDVVQLTSVARELSTYVEKKEAVPGALMRKLLGNDAMRLKAPTSDEGPVNKWRLPNIARQPREIRRDFTTNAWSLEERTLLNKIYLEMPKPTVATKVDSWRAFYENVCSRFIQFFPHRTLKESIAKLEDLLHRRVMKEVGENEYWEKVRLSPKKMGGCDLSGEEPAAEEASSVSSGSTFTNARRHQQPLKTSGSLAIGSSLTRP